MRNILLVHGFTTADGATSKLLGDIGGVLRTYTPASGGWAKISTPVLHSTSLADATNFLNYAFFVDGTSSNLSYDGTTLSNTTNVTDSPIGYYIENLGINMYIGNIMINSTRYRSRVWKSKPPKNNAVVWGLETGSDLTQTSSSAVVTSAGSSFISRGIEVGDPFFISNEGNAGEYVVRSVDSETQITLTKTLSASETNSTFWVGGNWFDVNTDDGDVITGFGKNSNELLILKRNSVHRYNEKSDTLRQVKTYPGTGSFRSIVNLNEFTYYYDPSSDAIRRYDGADCLIVSNAVEDLLENMSITMKDNVVGWKKKGSYVEMYIGDTQTRDGETISNCVLTLDTVGQVWSVRSLPFGIDYAGYWIQDGVEHTYLGTYDGKVVKVDPTATSYDTYDISFFVQDSPVFPEGADVQVEFERVRVFINRGQDIQIMYRLLYVPVEGNEFAWRHGEWEAVLGKASGDMTEFVFDEAKGRRGTGIQFRFLESSSSKSFLIEKYMLYYSNPAIR